MLEIYPFIVETIAMLRPVLVQVARQDPDLARQMRRAGSSIALNTAEGIGVGGGNERLRFRTALGSNLDVAEAWQYVDAIDPALRDRFDRHFTPNSRFARACGSERIAATLYRFAA